MADLLSLRGYAAHRRAKGLPGGNLNAVQKAISSGRITPAAGGKIDAARADAQWAALTPARAGGHDAAQTDRAAPRPPIDADDDGDAAQEARQEGGRQGNGTAQQNTGLLYLRARAARETATARMVAVKLDKLTGKLIDRDAVLESWARQVSMARTRFLGLPSKLRSRAPQLDAKTLALINSEIEDILRDLANAPRQDDDGSD